MVKIDLKHALRIKTAAGEVRKLKGSGFSWQSPVAAFPTLSVSNYAFWDAADAGAATWTPRHSGGMGVGQYFIRSGTVSTSAVRGRTMLDCTSGCYYGDKTGAAFPAALAFDVWTVCQADALNGPVFYNGPQADPGNLSNNIKIYLSDSRFYAGNRYAFWSDTVEDGATRSFHWARPTNSLISGVSVYQDGSLLTRAVQTDRAIDASGTHFVVGGVMNTAGQVVPATQFRMANVLVTFGENLSAADRANLDAWWRAA